MWIEILYIMGPERVKLPKYYRNKTNITNISTIYFFNEYPRLKSYIAALAVQYITYLLVRKSFYKIYDFTG